MRRGEASRNRRSSDRLERRSAATQRAAANWARAWSLREGGVMSMISPLAASERIPSPRSSNRGTTAKRDPREEDPRAVPATQEIDEDDQWSNMPCTD
jgi:hypothetical protein